MKLFIIDALGPFIFEDNIPHNWSKIPFEFYEKNGLSTHKKRIIKNFTTFIKRISSEGYTAISIDDLAHMCTFSIYSQKKQHILKEWIELYQELFVIAKKQKLDIYVNTDIMFYSKEIAFLTQHTDKDNIFFLQQAISQLFNTFPVSGIISRIGETDGVDVKGVFKSKIAIKKIAQARAYIKALLPIFEEHNKQWIFRTWTVGIGEIGDLMWNVKTAKKMLKGISSNNLILSVKYGNADFFRNLDLNNLFEIKSVAKIIELQTKREYDSFGELPYYTGFEYQEYYTQLKKHSDIIGIHVWCQTGGWIKTNKITFLKNSSPFVELNTISTINICKGKDATAEIDAYFKNPHAKEFIQRYNELSNRIMYPQRKSTKFFRKLYVPPILWVFWNNITINKLTSSFVRAIYQKHPIIKIEEFEEVQKMGKKAGFKQAEFYIQTLEILYKARMTLHGKYSIKNFEKDIITYNNKYQFFTVSIDDKKYSKMLFLLFRLSFRKNHKYTFLNTIMFNKFMISIFYKLFLRKKHSPKFIHTQGMKLEDMMK